MIVVPIVVPDPHPSPTGCVPEHLLRPLLAARAVSTFDPTDGSQTTQWVYTEFTGRLVRHTVTEVTTDGRQAAVTTYRLITNTPGLQATDRIVDTDEWPTPSDPYDFPYLLEGTPAAVYGATWVHHYEGVLRRARG